MSDQGQNPYPPQKSKNDAPAWTQDWTDEDHQLARQEALQAGNVDKNGDPLVRPPTHEGYPVGESHHSNPLYSQHRPPNQEIKILPSWHPMHNPDALAASSGQQNDAYESLDIKPSDFPVAGQQNDGKLVKSSDFHATAEMKSDGLQHILHAGWQHYGESGDNSRESRWFERRG